MEPPETRYAKSGDLSIAYQVVGDGPIDLVAVPGMMVNLETSWQQPAMARFHERCARFSRYILFDRRGTGQSDRVDSDAGLPVEERVDDVRAVMDAANSSRAAIYGVGDGGPIAIVFAATFPERTTGLILNATSARTRWAADFPSGLSDEECAALIALVEDGWGTGITAGMHGADESQRPALARMERLTGTPKMAAALVRAIFTTDVRDVLPLISTPTLVFNDHAAPMWRVDGGYLAEHIPNARSVDVSDGLIPGTQGVGPDEFVGAIEEFLTGSRASADADRILKTVLFTDIVDSTAQAVTLGDRRWRSLLDEHDAAVRDEIAGVGGQEIKTTGDGFLATFDGPARSIRCAQAITRRAGDLGIQVRAGVHAGECERRGDDIGGIAVHIAARICALAGPGEVLATRTVKDLTAGSGLSFADRGEHALKGIPDRWQLFAVSSPPL